MDDKNNSPQELQYKPPIVSYDTLNKINDISSAITVGFMNILAISLFNPSLFPKNVHKIIIGSEVFIINLLYGVNLFSKYYKN